MPKALVNRKDPLKGAKDVPPAHTHPWMTVKYSRFGKPYPDSVRYHKRLTDAKGQLLRELDADEYSWGRIGAQDAVAAITALRAQVSALKDEGGRVDGVLDPHSGVEYHAEIAPRKEFS
jgi:hypothetical protein